MDAERLEHAWSGEVRAAVDLEGLAADGASRIVYAQFLVMPKEARPGLSSRVLRQVFLYTCERLSELPLESVEWRREAGLIEEVLDLQRAHAAQGSAWMRAYHRSLLQWSRLAVDAGRLAAAAQHCAEAFDTNVLGDADLYPRFVLLEAEILRYTGRREAAQDKLLALEKRRELIPDRNFIPELYRALASTCLTKGDLATFRRLLAPALAEFYTDLDGRRALFDLARRAGGGFLGVLSGSWGIGHKMMFALHGLYYAARLVAGPARRFVDGGFLGFLFVLRGAWTRRALGGVSPESLADEPATVSRAMGGVGDMLMMTPAFHALAQAYGRPIRLRVPKRFLSLFQGNEDVKAEDIHDVEPRPTHSWFNLTDCPAARAESLVAPRVRRNRIELFARGLGIRGRWLRRMDRRPRWVVAPEEKEFARKFFVSRGLRQPVVGVQVNAAESYRDYPLMGDLVRELAGEYSVIVFGDNGLEEYAFRGVALATGASLRQAAALASRCAVIVAPDSSFVHFSAALGVPCVAITGPTDGKVRVSDYPLAVFVDARNEMPCVPCWRNEDTPCALTGTNVSVCMSQVPVQRVLETVREIVVPISASAAAERRHG